ncbi:hypothetical protein LXT13_10960 [Pelomonas sp. P8]|uniref:Uncharacterized protein n=1 Tax=Pelomonas cellulosilytica TaxID=2906762 RepID=A0ABS8XT97_9BURK|nr:hypothetical protein [Pelomonas sp. P8]
MPRVVRLLALCLLLVVWSYAVRGAGPGSMADTWEQGGRVDGRVPPVRIVTARPGS